MRKIVYYVASSLDGFISGPNDDISGFVGTGNGVKKYLSDLLNFDTVIMGRHTINLVTNSDFNQDYRLIRTCYIISFRTT
jgi:dihydrofolate reductase